MFKEARDEARFDWTMLGDVSAGRPNLGPTTNVTVYRLMQYTLRDVLIRDFGVEATDRAFYEAGTVAGRSYYERVITRRDSFNGFIEDLQETLRDLKVGILRVEQADLRTFSFTITVAEDLDCSGLPACGELVCSFDEGFLAGLLQAYTGRAMLVKEVDCWCSGERVCRFEARAV